MDILKYIESEVYYDPHGQQIYFKKKDKGDQLILDLRAWGDLSSTLGEEEATKAQDELGKFVADSINMNLSLMKIIAKRKKIPKGWISIEDHLPECYAHDLLNGGTTYKVKDQAGNQWESNVTDHHMWYHKAKELGITHWYNE